MTAPWRTHSPLGSRRAPSDRRSWLGELGEVVFLSRHAAIIALAVSAALVPGIGPNRAWIAAAVLAFVLPYNVVLQYWMRRTGRIPVVMAMTDQLVGIGFAWAAPTTWIPVLLVQLAEIGLATAAFGRRIAAIATAGSAAGLMVVGIITDQPEPVVGVLSFAIAAALLLLAVGALSEGERRLGLRYGRMVEDLDAIVWEALPDEPMFTYVSPRAEHILGYPLSDWYEPGFWASHIHPDDREAAVTGCEAATALLEDHELEYRMVAADGSIVHLHDVATVEADGAGRPLSLRGVMVDVTARKRAEERVRQYADVVESIQMAVLVARREQLHDTQDEGRDVLRIVAANPEAARMTNRPRDRLVGALVHEEFPGVDRSALLERLLAVAGGAPPFDVDGFPVRSAGDERVYSLHAFPLPGNAVGISLDDVTGPSMAAAALRRQALHDELTGLPNRALLYDRLRHALREAQRTGATVALLIMDLDQFKEVNDALGHHHGDLLLIELSRRLESLLRECDTIARLGGDEFALLLTTDVTCEGAITVAEKVVKTFEQPTEVDGLSLQTNASIGIALYPDHASDADSLAQRADVAMYQAKRTGSRFSVYAAEQDRSSVRRLTLVAELRRAVELDELVLHYQPSVDFRTGAVVRAEALVRWQHSTHGLMLPREFIGLAEVSGTIQPLTRWVIQQAVTQARAWMDDGLDLGVAVNLSVRNLYDRELAPWIAAVLKDAGLPPERLTVEITENEVMDDPVVAMDVLAGVAELGVATSIDDFGSGHSSLSYLKRLPIDEIKIDRSFVSGMREDEADAVIVGAIVDLGHKLGLSVVAEGVEDAEAAQRLAALGCDRGQGFYLGRPVPAAELLPRFVIALER